MESEKVEHEAARIGAMCPMWLKPGQLKRWRIQLERTVQQMAELCDTTPSSWKRWESGEVSIPRTTAMFTALQLGRPLSSSPVVPSPEEIKALRVSRGENQTQAAQSVDYGVDKWRTWEAGKPMPRIVWYIYQLGGVEAAKLEALRIWNETLGARQMKIINDEVDAQEKVRRDERREYRQMTPEEKARVDEERRVAEHVARINSIYDELNRVEESLAPLIFEIGDEPYKPKHFPHMDKPREPLDSKFMQMYPFAFALEKPARYHLLLKPLDDMSDLEREWCWQLQVDITKKLPDGETYVHSDILMLRDYHRKGTYRGSAEYREKYWADRGTLPPPRPGWVAAALIKNADAIDLWRAIFVPHWFDDRNWSRVSLAEKIWEEANGPHRRDWEYYPDLHSVYIHLREAFPVGRPGSRFEGRPIDEDSEELQEVVERFQQREKEGFPCYPSTMRAYFNFPADIMLPGVEQEEI